MPKLYKRATSFFKSQFKNKIAQFKKRPIRTMVGMGLRTGLAYQGLRSAYLGAKLGRQIYTAHQAYKVRRRIANNIRL